MSAEADQNIAVLREGYARWSDSRCSSIDHWLDMMADDFRFRSVADGAPGLEFITSDCGKDGLRRYLEGIAAEWEMLHFRVADLIADGDRVVAVVDSGWRNKATGKSLNLPMVNVWRFRGGRPIEYLEVYDTAKLVAAARP